MSGLAIRVEKSNITPFIFAVEDVENFFDANHGRGWQNRLLRSGRIVLLNFLYLIDPLVGLGPPLYQSQFGPLQRRVQLVDQILEAHFPTLLAIQELEERSTDPLHVLLVLMRLIEPCQLKNIRDSYW